jgi:hypothetical protein
LSRSAKEGHEEEGRREVVFVRWKKYDRKYGWCDGPGTLQAVLVESSRINGKPRQKIIAALGTIKEDAIEAQEAITIARFLTNALRNMYRLDLDPESQSKIRGAIYQKLGDWDKRRAMELLRQFYEVAKLTLSRGQIADLFEARLACEILTYKPEEETGI